MRGNTHSLAHRRPRRRAAPGSVTNDKIDAGLLALYFDPNTPPAVRKSTLAELCRIRDGGPEKLARQLLRQLTEPSFPALIGLLVSQAVAPARPNEVIGVSRRLTLTIDDTPDGRRFAVVSPEQREPLAECTLDEAGLAEVRKWARKALRS